MTITLSFQWTDFADLVGLDGKFDEWDNLLSSDHHQVCLPFLLYSEPVPLRDEILSIQAFGLIFDLASLFHLPLASGLISNCQKLVLLWRHP